MKPSFEYASQSFLALNPHLREVASAELERPSGNATLGATQAQGRDSGVFFVRVTSIRKRLLDPDNLAEKYHVDCCRYAGLIPGDTPDKIRLETTQRKATKGEEEGTEIVIDTLNP